HGHNAWHSSQGILALISAIRTAPIEPGMPVPPILVVAPPAIQLPKGPIAPKFEGGEKKCLGLSAAYRKVCEEAGCHFFDAGSIITSSAVDGVHLDEEQHLTLGSELSKYVRSLLHENVL
ncbi:MAG: GDSL family lipase, partial [Gammaproteobacteria bacterium]|nr:GDSL family lipase [Gammaproteobacteria bacterium]